MDDSFKKARDEAADKLQIEIDKIDEPGPGTYRPVGSWRDNFEDGADWAYEWCQKKLHIMSEQLKNAKADREEAIFRERIAESESRDFLSESDERLKELNLLRAEAEALAEALKSVWGHINTHGGMDIAKNALDRWRKFKGEE